MGELDEVLNQSVTIESFHSINEYGDPSYNAGVTYKAMVQRRVKIVRTFHGKDLSGSEAVSTCSVLMDGVVSAALDRFGRDRITMPDGTQPLILAIEDGIDDQGQTIYVEVST
jgi:hypothetical protein